MLVVQGSVLRLCQCSEVAKNVVIFSLSLRELSWRRYSNMSPMTTNVENYISPFGFRVNQALLRSYFAEWIVYFMENCVASILKFQQSKTI